MSDADVDHILSFSSVPRSQLSDLWNRFCEMQEHWDLDELCKRVEVRPEAGRKFHTSSEKRMALREARPLKIIRFDLEEWRAHCVQSAAREEERQAASARAQQERDDHRAVTDARFKELQKNITKMRLDARYNHRVLGSYLTKHALGCNMSGYMRFRVGILTTFGCP